MRLFEANHGNLDVKIFRQMMSSHTRMSEEQVNDLVRNLDNSETGFITIGSFLSGMHWLQRVSLRNSHSFINLFLYYFFEPFSAFQSIKDGIFQYLTYSGDALYHRDWQTRSLLIQAAFTLLASTIGRLLHQNHLFYEITSSRFALQDYID